MHQQGRRRAAGRAVPRNVPAVLPAIVQRRRSPHFQYVLLIEMSQLSVFLDELVERYCDPLSCDTASGVIVRAFTLFNRRLTRASRKFPIGGGRRYGLLLEFSPLWVLCCTTRCFSYQERASFLPPFPLSDPRRCTAIVPSPKTCQRGSARARLAGPLWRRHRWSRAFPISSGGDSSLLFEQSTALFERRR